MKKADRNFLIALILIVLALLMSCNKEEIITVEFDCYSELPDGNFRKNINYLTIEESQKELAPEIIESLFNCDSLVIK